MDLVIATRNAGKFREFSELLGAMPITLHSMAEYPGVVDPPETGVTFHENSLVKARAAVKATGLWAIGDDSGLCVDALGGAPGIYSARYAPGNDENRWQYLLRSIAHVPEGNRQAAFVCVLTLCGPAGETTVVEGRCDGSIAFAPRGEQGFGYDPVFLVKDDSRGRTMAELSADEKHVVSHRGRAFAALRPSLEAALARVG